jgi:oligoendopeptidase F
MAAFGDLFALSLIETVRGRDALAEAQGYPSAPAQVFDRRYLNLDSVRAVLSAVRSHGALAKVYEQDQLAHASLSTTDTSVGPWDLARARPPAPRVPLDTAIVLMRRALAALGPEYEEALERMLEPSSGRLDLGPGSHRTPGGFSFGTLGFPTGVYLSAYDSTPTGARRLVHESGHAMHRQLMIDAGAAPVYLSGSPWQSEAVSLFNELVVMDYAAAAAKSAADRARFEEAFLGKALDVFYSAQDAELELGVYDGVKRGTLRSPADFDSLSRSVDTAYTIWAARIPELAHRWIQVRLMWEDPLYLANYVYADLIGLKLFAMYEQDRRAFAPKYIGFLRAGYSDEPAVLIKHYFQFDLDPHSLLDDALRLVDARLRAYEMP